MMFRRIVCSLVLTLVFSGAAAARQPDAALTRDPAALAAAFSLDNSADPYIPPPVSLYEPGSQEQFWIGKTTDETPTRITATLLAATPSLYIWLEDDIDVPYDPDQVDAFALELEGILNVVRWRSTYRNPDGLLGGLTEVYDPDDRFALPDIDNDPHLHIVFTTDLASERDAVYNPNDSLPAFRVPGGYSNEREVIAVNTSPNPGVSLTDGGYVNLLLRTFVRLVGETSTPEQALWLREALQWWLQYQGQSAQLGTGDVSAYLSAPNTTLIQPSTLTTRTQTIAMQQLFLAYFQQRYGADALLALYRASGAGMTPIDTVLTAEGIIDPITGAPVTSTDVFADFVVTNLVNVPFGDLRYFYRNVQAARNQRYNPPSTAEALSEETATVAQYAVYAVFEPSVQPGGYTVTFSGAAHTPRLPLPGGIDEDSFYWSGGASDRVHTLTRAFDLRGVETAALEYDVWYSLADGWNYGYVLVSTDDGQTWTALSAEGVPDASGAALGTRADNPFGVAYGVGYTGSSNPRGVRPFPVMGVMMGADGVTVESVNRDSPAERAGVQAGDVIIGYNGAVWEGAPNVLSLLAQYAPGETLRLYIQRGSDPLDVPLVLDAHPTRVIEPDPLWLRQRVDLSAYAGDEILVRFAYISLPEHENFGVALDEITLVALDYHDDAEQNAGGWTSAGWQRIDNRVEQRWLVQAVTTGTPTAAPTVQRLLDPQDGVEGTWRLNIRPEEQFVVAVSALSDQTTQPAQFTLAIAPAS